MPHESGNPDRSLKLRMQTVTRSRCGEMFQLRAKIATPYTLA